MEPQVSQAYSVGKLKSAVAVLALGVVGAGAYSVHEHNVAKNATEQSTQVAASLKSTNAQVEALTAKLNELSAPKPAPVIPAAKSATARPHKAAATRREDPRWKKLQAQLNEQGKAIDATRQDLDSAKTELTGSIARTHDELVVLQRKGERNYIEFNIDKSKQFSQHGPFGVKLKKANVKNQFADLELMVDDVKLTKKHVNLYEPAMFYASEGDQPIQLVINKITKDHIRGYISAPKYAASELNAMSVNATPEGQPQNSISAKPRERLTLPK
jgi:hypothetical protein